MLTFFKKFFNAFLFDELAFVRWARGLMITIGISGVGFGDQLSQYVQAPGVIKAIKVASVCCVFFGAAITAGQKNSKESSDGNQVQS